MKQQTRGVLFGLAAFVAWGLLPAYWKQMQAVPPLEILCHRVVWSCLFLALMISWQQRWGEVRQLIKTAAILKGLAISGCLVCANWFVYIWAVNSGRVVETSLGYYINPMISVVLGYFLLGEKFLKMQWLAVLLALAGVIYSLLAYGALPFFALGLAFSFGFYGYARKKIPAAPIPGLLVETMVLCLPAAFYIIYCKGSGHSLFLTETHITLWMVGSGLVTSLPLLWFASAAKMINLSSVGILQYIAPSLAFFLGVFIYKEPFSLHTLVTFCFIWIGVALYTAASFHSVRSVGRQSDVPEPLEDQIDP